MPTHFTREQQQEIREALFLAGIRLLKKAGVKKMTISKLTKECGIAKGSFYHFYESKEEFLSALIEYADRKTNEMLVRKLNGRKQMSVHEFFEFYREYLYSDYDLMNSLTIDDFLWLREHMAGKELFLPSKGLESANFCLSLMADARADLNAGVIVNLIKAIYAMREHRKNLVEDSLDESIDLILRLLEDYVSDPAGRRA